MDMSQPHFAPTPHASLRNTEARAFEVVDAFTFVDGNNQRWTAPPGTLTDGASIPQFFLSFTGDPMSPEFRAAAVVHDAFCGMDNKDGASYHQKPWEDVHHMFYEACLACGTPKLKALTLYAAVRLGGPRWTMDKETGKETSKDVSLRDIVPQERLVQEMRRCKDFIETENPSVEEVDAWMQMQENSLR